MAKIDPFGLTILFAALFLLSPFFPNSASCLDVCQPAHCPQSTVSVRFPFRLKHRHGDRCGYPGFELYCNGSGRTLLKLPSGDFAVSRIDYVSRAIYIDLDLDLCSTDRIRSFSLDAGSIFGGGRLWNYTFLNCSSSYSPPPEMMYHFGRPIRCLSGEEHKVFALISPTGEEIDWLPPSCRKIITISLPVHGRYTGHDMPYMMSTGSINLPLVWTKADCGDCEARDGICGFRSRTGLEIACFVNSPTNGKIPRSVKYGIILGVGIPGLVSVIGLVCYLSSKIREYGQRGQQASRFRAQISNMEPRMMITGLNGPTIESYPKIILGESKRLPEPNDGTCAICLSEYQPKETVRSLPKCAHCFHVRCIDEWLKLNASCPVCRNSPESSSAITPSSSVSSTTPLSSTPLSSRSILPVMPLP